MSDYGVIGSGIAGLAFALFARERGLDVSLHEKQPNLIADDGLLWIAPNGLRMLDVLGLLDDVIHLGTIQDQMVFSDKQLRCLSRLDVGALCRATGDPIVAVRRQDLYDKLYQKFCATGGRIHFGCRLTRLETQNQRCRAFFDNAAEPMVFRALIAADGIGSTTRQDLVPGSGVRYQGICTYLGQRKAPFAARYKGQTIEAWGVGTRFMLTSLDGETMTFSAMIRPPQYHKNSDPVPPTFTAELQSHFAGYHENVHALLEPASDFTLKRCNFGVVEGLREYAQGNIAWIGDAAHGMPPNMGQGASLALEDAWLLAKYLSECATPEAAFHLYSQRRRVRVHPIMSMANVMNNSFQPTSRLLATLRDLIARSLPTALTTYRMAALYRLPHEFDLSPTGQRQ